MSELNLIVNGRRYGGWKSVRVTRSMESLCGSFDLEVSDRWAAQEKPWPIREEDPCRVEIDGTLVIDGFIGKRRLGGSGTSRSLSYEGKDRAGSMVASSANLTKWSFRNTTFLDLARKMAEPFGVAVSVQPGLELRSLNNLSKKTSTVSPGEGAFSVVEQAARAAGVLVISDGAGGILVTQSGSTRASASLIESVNILDYGVEYDADERFYKYVIASQIQGEDTKYGVDTQILATAIDAGVKRKERVLFIVAEKALGIDYARRRADWEARVRAARAMKASISVVGWKQGPGLPLWQLNTLVPVHAPSTMEIDGELLIVTTEMSLDDQGGEVTHLELMRPDAFIPDPSAVVESSEAGPYKELRTGGLLP